MGFKPFRTEARLTDVPLRLDIELEVVAQQLATVTKRITHVGLTGFVLDTAGMPVEGATIRAYTGQPQPDTLRSHAMVRTEGDGGFFLALPPGYHTLRVSRKEYSAITMVVLVPLKGGRCVVMRLGPGERGLQRAERCPIAAESD